AIGLALIVDMTGTRQSCGACRGVGEINVTCSRAEVTGTAADVWITDQHIGGHTVCRGAPFGGDGRADRRIRHGPRGWASVVGRPVWTRKVAAACSSTTL